MELYGPYSKTVETMMVRLSRLAVPLQEKQRYFEGDIPTTSLGISLPSSVKRLKLASPWTRMIITAMSERINMIGVSHPDAEGQELLRTVARNSDLKSEVALAARDSLIYGCGFLSISDGDDGVRIAAEDPMTTTGVWDPRTRRLAAALKVLYDDSDPDVAPGVSVGWSLAELHLPGEIITITPDGIVDVSSSGLAHIPLVALPNEGRTSAPWGQSEITTSLRRLCDEHLRLQALHVISSEFYSRPQKIILGIEDDEVGDLWDAVMGKVQTIADDEEAINPRAEVIQLAASDPRPFLASLERILHDMSATSGIPATRFGLEMSSTPSSAEALRHSENALISRIESKIPRINSAVVQACELALEAMGYESDEQTVVEWARVSSPTPGATADMLNKMIAAQSLAPTSSYVYRELGLSPEDAEEARDEVLRSSLPSTLAGILEQAKTAVEKPDGGSSIENLPNSSAQADAGVI